MAETQGISAEAQQRAARIYSQLNDWNKKYNLGMSNQEVMEWVDKSGLESGFDDPALQTSSADCVGIYQCSKGLGNEVAGYVTSGIDRYKGQDLSAVSAKIKGADLSQDDEANFLTAYFYKEHGKEQLAKDLSTNPKFKDNLAETLASPVTAYLLHFTPGKAEEVLTSDDSRPITEIYPDSNPGDGKGIIEQNPGLFKDVKTVGDFKGRIGTLLNQKAEQSNQLVADSKEQFSLITDYLRAHGQSDLVKQADELYAKKDIAKAQELLISGVASELGLDKEGLSSEERSGRVLLAAKLGVEETQKVLDPANKDKKLSELGIPSDRIEKLRDVLGKAKVENIPDAASITAGQALEMSTQAAKNAPALFEEAAKSGEDKDGNGTPDWMEMAKQFLPLLGGMTTEGMLCIALIACACMAMGSSKDGGAGAPGVGQGAASPQQQEHALEGQMLAAASKDDQGLTLLTSRVTALNQLTDNGFASAAEMQTAITSLHQGNADPLAALMQKSTDAFIAQNKDSLTPDQLKQAQDQGAAGINAIKALTGPEKEALADAYTVMQQVSATSDVTYTVAAQGQAPVQGSLSLKGVFANPGDPQALSSNPDIAKLKGTLQSIIVNSGSVDGFSVAEAPAPAATPAVTPPAATPTTAPVPGSTAPVKVPAQAGGGVSL